MTVETLLIRLLIAVLVYWLGSKVISIIGGKAAEVLDVVLLIAVVLYVVLGSTFIR